MNPFDEFKKQFEFALKGSDLHALLSLRDKYITILASSYNPGSYNEERRSLCFRSLEAATKLATKDVEVLKTVFTQFFDEPSDESDSLNSCGKTFSPPAKQILPIQPKQEESATDDDTEATVQLTEECDSSTWQDCKPLSKSEILILNNAAFLLQKMGQHTEAIKLLRYVLKQDPQRKVAYKNLGDSLAAQKKSGSSLALIAASVVKRNPKILSSAEVRSIAEQIGATCERSETMTSSISDRLNVTEFEFRCQPLGAKDDLGSLRARWDYNLDDVVIIKTLEDKKSSKNDPVSGVVNQKQLKSSK